MKLDQISNFCIHNLYFKSTCYKAVLGCVRRLCKKMTQIEFRHKICMTDAKRLREKSVYNKKSNIFTSCNKKAKRSHRWIMNSYMNS